MTTISKSIQGGEFLIRDTEAQAIFIPEEFTEEQRMMAQACQDFIDTEINPNIEAIDSMKNPELVPSLFKKAGDLGLLGISVPEQYGGLGMSFNTSMLIADIIGGAGSFSTTYGAHTGIGTLPILYYGTEEQKQKYIPKLASGEWKGAYGLTEPNSGSDALSAKTTAVLSADGQHYILNGQKCWITNGGFADVYTVFAKIDGEKFTGFIVEKGTEGFTQGPEEHKMGIKGSSTRQVFFNDVVVPETNLLGAREEGFKIALNILNIGRIKLAAAALGAAKKIASNAVNYANERIQFGHSIANYGAIKHKIAEQAIRIYALESALYRAGQQIDEATNEFLAKGMNDEEAKLKGVEEYAVEAAILKVFGSEVLDFVADEGVQIYGGMGFSEDTPMESAWRDARIARIYEGTNEINRMLSVGMLIKKAMKGHVDLLGPAMKVQEELMGIPSFDTPDYSELFSEEKEMVGKLKKAFLMVAGAAVQKYGMDLDAHQQLLMAAADMLIEIYMAESTVLRTEKLAKKVGENKATEQIAMAKLYLYKAVDVVSQKGKESIISFAEGDEQRMMLMGLRRFTKYTNMPNIVGLRETITAKLVAENSYCF